MTETKGIDFNIFLYLAKLEKDGMNSSNQSKSTILARLDYLEAEYKKQIANWKSDSDKVGTDAQSATKQAGASDAHDLFTGPLGVLIGCMCVWAEIGAVCGTKSDSDKKTLYQGLMQEDVQNANIDQNEVQQTQQKMSMSENIELNSQQQSQQSMQNMFNSMVRNFGSMGSYNNQRG